VFNTSFPITNYIVRKFIKKSFFSNIMQYYQILEDVG